MNDERLDESEVNRVNCGEADARELHLEIIRPSKYLI